MATRNATERLLLRLTPEVMARVERISEELGVRPTQLAAIWVGQQSHGVAKSLDLLDRLGDTASAELLDMMNPQGSDDA